MDSLHRREAGAVEVHQRIPNPVLKDSVQKTAKAATSPSIPASLAPALRIVTLAVHYLPLIGAPFFGINNGTGGVILCTCEKFRSFTANPIRPRESW